MAGVYRLGDPKYYTRVLSNSAAAWGKRQAAERLAAQKLEEERLKAAKKALEKAKKERAKAEKERKKLVGPLTDTEITDLGYSGPGHYRTAADRYGEFSTGDQAGYTEKQMDAELKANAAAEAAKLKAIRSSNIEPGMPYPVADIDAEKLKFKIRQKEIEEAKKAERIRQLKTIRGFDSEAYVTQQRIDAYESKQPPGIAAAESAKIRLQEQAGAVGDYPVDTLQINKERKEIAVLAEKIEKAQIVAAAKKAKDDAAWWAKQRALEAAETKAAMTRLGAGDITKKFGESGNIEWSDKRRAELFNLTDAAAKIRGEARDAGTVPSGGWPLPQYLASQVGFPPKQGLTFERIQEIETDFEAYEKDAVTQSIMDIAKQQALHKGGEATTRSEFIKIQRLVADGKLTIVQITDNTDGTMDASPVSEDGLREQLRATDPTYIDAGPNPVVRIGGVLYEKFGDQFFPLEEMTTDEGMDIGGLPQLRYDSRRMTPPSMPALDSLNTSITPIPAPTGFDSYSRSIFRS